MLVPGPDDGGLIHIRLARRLLGRPLYWTGAYLFGKVLIDCGPAATAGEFLSWLRGREVEALLLTHHHEDHVGAAAALGAERGLVPQAHAAALPLLGDGFVQEFYRRVVWGRPRRLKVQALQGEVRMGDIHLQAIHTPGHSVDHVCYFEPDRGWLFTGDLFLSERLRYLRSDEDLGLLIGSLHTVSRLEPRRVLCAHRGTVADGPAALRRKHDRLVSLRERVRELLAQGLPEKEVARRTVGREGPLTWFSLGRFSARNFVRAIASGSRARPLC